MDMYSMDLQSGLIDDSKNNKENNCLNSIKEKPESYKENVQSDYDSDEDKCNEEFSYDDEDDENAANGADEDDEDDDLDSDENNNEDNLDESFSNSTADKVKKSKKSKIKSGRKKIKKEYLSNELSSHHSQQSATSVQPVFNGSAFNMTPYTNNSHLAQANQSSLYQNTFNCLPHTNTNSKLTNMIANNIDMNGSIMNSGLHTNHISNSNKKEKGEFCLQSNRHANWSVGLSSRNI